MAKTRKLQVEIVGDSGSLERAFGRSGKASSKFGKESSKLGKTMRATGKAAGLMAGALGAGIAGAAAIGVKGLIADEKAMAKVESALKSTSNAAGVTKDDILKLSNSMQAQTGIGGDLIRTNQSILLSFTNVKNGVKEGDKVFDRATRSIVDMSVALDQDMKSSATMVGKALQDPIRGVTALQRVGVVLTDSQKEQIKVMQDSGNTMGAQKVILKELEVQFGGTANAVGQTAAGQWARAKVAFEEVAKTATKELLPILTKVADWMNRKGIPAIASFAATTEKTMEKWRPKIIAVFQAVQVFAAKMVAWFKKDVQPFLSELVATWQSAAVKFQTFWSRWGDDILRVTRAIMRVLAPILKNTIGAVFDALRVLMAVFRGDWSTAWKNIQSLATRPMKAMSGALKGIFQDLLPALASLGTKVGTATASRMMSALSSLPGKMRALGADAMRALRDGVTNSVKLPANSAIGGMNRMLNAVDGAIPGPDFIPSIPRLAEGDVVSAPTLAVIGEDGPEAVIPLGAKRRKRGQHLLTQAALMMNMDGDYPGPDSGIRMLALGGIFGAGAGAAKSIGSGAVGSLKSAGSSSLDSVTGLARAGAASVIGKIPTPSIGLPMFDGIIRMVREVVIEGIRQGFARKDEWSFGDVGAAKGWAESQMGKPYIWGGGHGPWNYNLPGYDCSGFASHAAKKAGSTIGSAGTTFTLSPISTRTSGDAPFAFGFRGMHSGNPRVQHMGAKIAGDWYQFGNPGKKGGTDSQWEYLSAPPGLPSYETGTSFVPDTGPAILHQGEMVVPRGPADAMRSGSGSGVTIQGNLVVRNETDARVMADHLGRYLEGVR